MPNAQDFEMLPVSSSNLAAVGYHEDSQTLRIEFNSGAVYDYGAVPKRVFEELLEADSVGTFFHRNIQHEFSYRRV